MNHQIYTGSFSALETRWIDIITELQRDDSLRPVHVLTGSNLLASYLKRRYAETGRAAANIRFCTFVDLASRLASLSPTVEVKPALSRLGASIILESILSTDTPPVFESLTGYTGFRDSLLDTFRDLRDAGIHPPDLELSLKNSIASMPDRRDQLLGLADLYRRFREHVRIFHGVDDDFRAAVGNVLSVEQSPDIKQLLVYGIYDVTGQQAQLLAGLRRVACMIYFIPYIDETVSEFANPFLDKCINELHVRRNHLNTPDAGNSLAALKTGNFGFSDSLKTRGGIDPAAVSPASDGSFALISAPGESRVATEILREIFRSIRDGIINGFHEAAVILRQPEIDIPILTEAFRLRGIPYFVHGGTGFADRPLSKAIKALAGLESDQFSREAVITALELVAAALPETEAAVWNVPEWRALTNTPRFLAGVESWDFGIDTLIREAHDSLRRAEAGEEDNDSETAGIPSVPKAREHLESVKALQTGWKILKSVITGWPSSLTWREWVNFLERLYQPLFGDSEDWHYFSDILDELGSLETLARIPRLDQKISRNRINKALTESLSLLAYPEGRFQRRGVNLLSTSAARGLCFPLVVIPGLEEGRFPARLRQDPLLLDSERSLIGGLPLKSRRSEEEKLLFDMAARSAEKRLVLITSRLDESSDRECIPSQFFLRVAAAVQGRVVSLHELRQGNIPGFRSVSLENPAPAEGEIAVDEGEIRLRLVTAHRHSAWTVLAAMAKLEPMRLNRPISFDRARWIKKLTEFDGSLSDPRLIRWVAERMGASAGQVSASRLEEYAKCPYFFFLKRVMGLEAWEEQQETEAMDPLERGLAIHSILEKFLADFCGKKFAEASEEELWRLLSSQAHDILEERRPAGIPDLLWEIERDGLYAMLENWLLFEKSRAAGGMLPVQLERTFGEFTPQERSPALIIQAGNHLFRFRGRIDRIDISSDGKHARVIDYKTGTLPDSMSRSARTPLMSGERIQIAIYKEALAMLDEFRNVEAVEGEYLHLQPRDGRIVPCSFDSGELQEASGKLPEVLAILGAGIENGVFFARSKGMVRPSGHCDFCNYLPVCGKDRVNREERKANDAAVRRFLSIREIDGSVQNDEEAT
jgi:ATP-dependent helicase/DNAse subunit B